MNMLRVAIVDDEAPARANLRAALTAMPIRTSVTGEANSVETAVAMLHETQPDLVLLDIWLGDGTGFDVLEQIKDSDLRVVFVTAFDHHAVQAFQQGALHYLLKPVVRADLQQALERAMAVPAVAPKELSAVQRSLTDRITVSTAEGFHVLDPYTVMRCESDGNYTRLYLTDGTKVLASRTLKEFETMLTPFGFLRVHLSHLVNTAHVKMYLHREGGTLVLHNGHEVPVSHRRRAEVVAALGR